MFGDRQAAMHLRSQWQERFEFALNIIAKKNEQNAQHILFCLMLIERLPLNLYF